MPSDVLFSTAYFPPISYFAQLIKTDTIIIEQQEHYIKQTYRNRAEIYGANGKLALTIPINHQNLASIPIKEVKISYEQPWQKIHWRSIESAYRNSPYFEYYENEIKVFYEKDYIYLFEWNHELLITMLKMLGLSKPISFTSSYSEQHENSVDLRNEYNPGKSLSQVTNAYPQYTQVFSDRYGFLPDLSIIDLLFNEGIKAVSYLEKMSL